MVNTHLVRVLGVVLLLAMLSIGCGDGGSRYDEETRNAFLLSCQSEGGDASGCEKVLSCIEGKMSQETFEYEGSRIAITGEFSDRMADVMARCIAA